MNPISDEVKEKIIDFYFDKGFKMTEIEKKLNISRPVISKIINDEKQKNNIDVKFAKVNVTKKNSKESKTLCYSINVPPAFVKALDLINEDLEKNPNIKLFIDKNEKEMKIKKFNRKD